MEEKLAAYPQPLSEDLVQLATPGLLPPFSNQRHAVIQVSGEKEVLLHYRELCEVALQLIDSEDFLIDEVSACVCVGLMALCWFNRSLLFTYNFSRTHVSIILSFTLLDF